MMVNRDNLSKSLCLVADNDTRHALIPPDRIAAWTILDGDGVSPTALLKTHKRAQDTLERAELAMAEVGSRTRFLLVYDGTDCAGGWQPLDAHLRTVATLDPFVLAKPLAKGYTMRMLQLSELHRAGFPGQVHVSAGHTTEQDPAPRQRGLSAIDEAPCPRSHHQRLTET